MLEENGFYIYKYVEILRLLLIGWQENADYRSPLCKDGKGRLQSFSYNLLKCLAIIYIQNIIKMLMHFQNRC